MVLLGVYSMDFYLPNVETGEGELHHTEKQAVIIIGANGSGKSHSAAFIEEQDFEKDVHEDRKKGRGGKCLRISAQRILNFDDFIPLDSYERSINKIIYGGYGIESDKPYNKWTMNGRTNWTTVVTNDFDSVLAATIAKINLEYKAYYENSLENKEEDCEQAKHNLTIDRIKRIWRKVLSERDITISDGQVLSHVPGAKSEYNANQMSDGERVCLYMICQVLSAPSNMLIIVDEPELHLHPSIMNKLWNTLEQARPDCHFIYVTHDTEFASNHPDAEIIWVKSYDGHSKWEYEILKENELPDELFLKILGNRKNVLFIEGKSGSWDYKIYGSIFNNFFIIPCASCNDVIRKTKTYNENNLLHHLKVFGIVDRDYRNENEIDALRSANVYCIEVAEVENLFLTEEVLRVFHKSRSISVQTSNHLIENIKNEVRNHFKTELSDQKSKALNAMIKYHFSVLPLKGSYNSIDDLKKYIEIDIEQKIKDFDGILKKRYDNINDSGDYNEIIKIYNNKGLFSVLGKVAASFAKNTDNNEEIDSKFYGDYRGFIIRSLQNPSEVNRDLKKAFMKFLPKEIIDVNNQS